MLHMPAAVWHTLVDDLVEHNLGCDAPLRLLRLGGDTPDIARLNAFGKMLPGVAGGALPYLNLYGPTEATITATLYRTTTAVSGFDRLPIGTPLPNVQIHLLDAHGQPVPVGIPGEIYIGGAPMSNPPTCNLLTCNPCEAKLRTVASTAPATSRGGCRTAISSSSAVRMTRSRFAGSAWSRAKSKQRWSG